MYSSKIIFGARRISKTVTSNNNSAEDNAEEEMVYNYVFNKQPKPVRPGFVQRPFSSKVAPNKSISQDKYNPNRLSAKSL